VQAGFSFGDNRSTLFNVYAHHISQKGQLAFQEYRQTGFSLRGAHRTANNIEFSGKVSLDQDQYFQYGFQPKTLSFTKDDLRRRYQTIGIEAGLRNTKETEFSLLYHPTLKLGIFSDNNKNNESNAVLNLPLEKMVGRTFGIKLGLTADLTRYTAKQIPNDLTITNNLFYVSPALLFKTPNVTIHGGIIPSWDNNQFNLLPDITADVRLSDDKFVLQLGWVGYYNKTNYQNLVARNPYIDAPLSLANTRVQERFGGFKGSVADHFSYSARVGYLQYNNLPLFVNDGVDSRAFRIANEAELQALHLHGELGFTQGEIFELKAGLHFYQFSKLATNAKAWGMLPIELTSSLRWRVLNGLWVKSDLFMWDGARYLATGGFDRKLPAAVDLNAGLEFKITKSLNAWFQMNNILNNKYQRWHEYESLGFQVMGGIVFSFAQINNKN
jgi:hypothetical protein